MTGYTFAGYMRRVPQGEFSDAGTVRSTKALARAIFGTPSPVIVEAHGLVGFLFWNMLEVWSPEPQEDENV